MLADLDELVMRCRDERARKYIDEAVRCYRSGAYRAAVVATWIAVCFDFVDKLRELAAAGDSHAEKIAADLEKHQAAGDFQSAMKFEATIPSLALQFEFVSHTEKIDLERLKEDRNRCAHPSQNNDSEVFEVASELSRLHIRNAVCHLLQHEPAQGNGALDRLLEDVGSVTFPSSFEKVMERLKEGALPKAREALIRNFFVVLMKSIFLEKVDHKRRNKCQQVLMCGRQMHPHIWEKTVVDVFGKQLERATSDEMLLVAVSGFSNGCEMLWSALSEPQKERLLNFVKNSPSSVFDELYSLNDNIFDTARNARYSEATFKEITDSLWFDFPPILQERMATFVRHAQNYASANKYFQCIASNATDFSQITVAKLIVAASKNSQAYDAGGFATVLQKFRDAKHIGAEFVDKCLASNGLQQLIHSDDDL
jgi:hypothetical protein